MDFESAHRLFIDTHLQERSSERRDRLMRGHREAEKLFCRNVWWPLLHNFDHLHPEYEVTDWRGLHYFAILSGARPTSNWSSRSKVSVLTFRTWTAENFAAN